MTEHTNNRNPLLPLSVHVPDSEAHVMPDGKLYLYGSFDNRSDGLYCSEEYHVVSTPDLLHWQVGDVSFRGEDVPWFRDPDKAKYPGVDWTHPTPFLQKMLADMLAGKSEEDMKAMFDAQKEVPLSEQPALLFAPDCIHRDGKYYLYFCMADNSEGVAVSDSPMGPFADAVQLPVGGIDPAIFVDEDGQAYYYWGQIFSHGVKLHPDMVSFDADGIVDNLVTEEKHCFHEGSSMRRRGDWYYYVYADMERGKPTSLGYSMSRSPLGPFEYKGIIIDNDGCDPASWNNHGSIECVDGQWYVFYHRCSRGGQTWRRLCAEKIRFNEDGTIDEVKMTSQGVGDPFGPGEHIEGYRACGLTGTVYIGTDDAWEEKLTSISAGDTAVFRYVKKDAAWASVAVTLSGTGRILVKMNGEPAGVIDASEAAEGSGERTVAAPLSCPAGEYELLLEFAESSGLEVMDIVLN